MENEGVETVALAEIKSNVQELATVELPSIGTLLHDEDAVPKCIV